MKKEIKFGDLTSVEPRVKGEQVAAWNVEIDGFTVSIVRWSSNRYKDNKFEIYSWEMLFKDIERFKSMKLVLARLNDLNSITNHSCNDTKSTINVKTMVATCTWCGNVSKIKHEGVKDGK